MSAFVGNTISVICAIVVAIPSFALYKKYGNVPGPVNLPIIKRNEHNPDFQAYDVKFFDESRIAN